MPRVVVRLREVGDDVRRRAAARDDVVDARLLRHVLAHHVHHVVHGLDRVERRPPALRRRRRVRRDAVEAELGVDDGEVRRRARVVAIAGMPRDHRVDVLEQPVANHVDLAGAALLRRRAEIAQRPRMSGREPFLDGDRRRQRSGAEQVVPAPVAWRVVLDRVTVRGLRFLRQAGQRVELADDADHRLAGTERRDERGGHAGDAGGHLEAGGLQLLLQQRAALRLLKADFGEAPDLLRDAGVFVAPRVDGAQHRRAIVGGRRLRGHGGNGSVVSGSSGTNRQQQHQSNDGFSTHRGHSS